MFCSRDCFNAHKIAKAARHCLFCGRDYYRRGLGRKMPKSGSVRLLNAFCSKRCAKLFTSWQACRKARCAGCGKATGAIKVKCLACKRKTSDWKELGGWKNAIRRIQASRLPEPWEVRCNAAVTSLRTRRDPKGIRHRVYYSSWREKICSQIHKIAKRKTAWEQKCDTARANLKHRIRTRSN